MGPSNTLSLEAERTEEAIGLIPRVSSATQTYQLSRSVQESPAHCATTVGRIYAYLQHTAASMIVRSFTRLDYLSRSALLTVFKNKQNILIFTVYNCMLNQHGLTSYLGLSKSTLLTVLQQQATHTYTV